MKERSKKVAATLLSMVMSVGCVTGCFAQGKEDSTEMVWTMEAVYAKAQDLGYNGSLEEFMQSISNLKQNGNN